MTSYEDLYGRPCRSPVLLDGGGRETLHGSRFDQGYLREGGLDTEAEAAFLMSPRQGKTSQHSA